MSSTAGLEALNSLHSSGFFIAIGAALGIVVLVMLVLLWIGRDKNGRL